MSNQDWWSKKLGQEPQGRPDPTPPMPLSQQPMTPMPVFQPQTPTQSKAQSVNQNTTCPNCWSSNYFSYQNTSPRCYDCGYPVQQSGSAYGALSVANVEGAAKPAIGNSGTSGFSPMPDGYGPNGQKLG